MVKISLITIGTELLKGRIVNTNASDIGKMLRPHGYKLSRTIVIPDEKATIHATLRAEMQTHEVVLICGGLGPTNDDMTKTVLLEALGNRLVLHAPTLAYLEAHYLQRGRDFSERNRQQAMVPDTCKVLPNPLGTAPGLWFDQAGTWVIAMPGVPFEMRQMMEHEVIPRLQQHKPGGYFCHEILRLAQIPESDTADRIHPLLPSLAPQVEIAYLPRIDGIWLELYLEQDDPTHSAEADAALADAVEKVATVFSDKIYARGDVSLTQLVHEAFLASGQTLAIAESITGGGIASELISLSGASKFLRGSLCTYGTGLKVDLLGVSQECIARETVVSQCAAEEMARQVRLVAGSDVGISTTGYAEPHNGDTPHAWIGFSSQHKTLAQRYALYGDRNTGIQRTVYHALQFCLQNL